MDVGPACQRRTLSLFQVGSGLHFPCVEQFPINEWIKKLWYIYTMEYYAAERKKELLPFATVWIELESIMLSVISQAVRDKYHMISPLTGTYQQKKKASKI